MKNWGIRTRVLLLALLPAFTIAVTLAGYMSYRVTVDSERNLLNLGIAESRQLAALAEYSTYSGDHETLARFAQAALEEESITKVSFFDQSGMQIAGSNPLQPPGALTSRPDQPALVESNNEHMVFVAPIIPRRYDAYDPFLNESASTAAPKQVAPIGWVSLELSLTIPQQQTRRTLYFTLATTFIVLILGAWLAIILGRQVTRPIIRLENAVTRIQKGHLDVRVQTDSGGDLQRLEEGMNAMAETLNVNREFLEARVRIATHKLEQKMHEAELSSIAKSRFLAAASHDLRQPLHALSLFTADLRHTAETPAQNKLAGQINESVRGISELLDSLLDISRLDVAGVTPALQDFPLTDMFQRLDANFARSAAGKSLRFLCRPTPFWVRTDPVLLEQMLRNLLSNAIRYTEHGGIMLLARKRGDCIRIEVRDSGIGILAEHQQSVFSEFFQVENTAREHGQGLGLGLAIVSRLATILGLTVGLSSAPGRGSTFVVTLPLAEPLPTHDIATETLFAVPTRLLLLYPQTTALTEASVLAREWGFGSEWAASLDEALQRARDSKMIIVGETAMHAAGTLNTLHGTGISTILLGSVREDCPASTHFMPLPVRPAKLRALLSQLLAEKTTGPTIDPKA